MVRVVVSSVSEFLERHFVRWCTHFTKRSGNHTFTKPAPHQQNVGANISFISQLQNANIPIESEANEKCNSVTKDSVQENLSLFCHIYFQA